jgi:hypothetical protein
MGNYKEQLIGETLSASGGSTSFTIPASLKETIRIQVVGDSNSTSLDIATTGKTAPASPFGQNGFADETAKDLTKQLNNSEIFKIDATGVNTIRVEITNNANSETIIDVYEAFVTER